MLKSVPPLELRPPRLFFLGNSAVLTPFRATAMAFLLRTRAYRSLVRPCCGRSSRSSPFGSLGAHPPPTAFSRLRQGLFYRMAFNARFETASARLTAFRTGRPLVAAFPARAPTTPPTTAPTGPAMLPIAAPATAPAVCFGIGGTWISSDDRGLFFFSGFGWSGINVNSCNIFD
jgi:hypothetical protein